MKSGTGVADGLPMAKSPFMGFIRTFLNLYVYKGSYREGAFGLIMSLFFAHGQFSLLGKAMENRGEGRTYQARSTSRCLDRASGSLLSCIWLKTATAAVGDPRGVTLSAIRYVRLLIAGATFTSIG